jgi:hypothetical protein
MSDPMRPPGEQAMLLLTTASPKSICVRDT